MYNMQNNLYNPSKEYYNSTVNLEDAAAVFKFGADNTSVEWKMDVYNDKGSKTAIVGTLHKEGSVFSDKKSELNVKGNKIVDLHSHPYNDKASGQDMRILKIKTGTIYHKDSQTLFNYNKRNSHINTGDTKATNSSDLSKFLKNNFMK